MDLIQANQQDMPLAWRPSDAIDDWRLLAYVFRLPHGLLIVDPGWSTTTSHPFHTVRGRLSGAGPWRCGPARFARIEHGDALAGDWNQWLDYATEGAPGAYETRALTKVALIKHGLWQKGWKDS